MIVTRGQFSTETALHLCVLDIRSAKMIPHIIGGVGGQSGLSSLSWINTMVPVCNTSPHKFIFQRNLFYSKNKVLTYQLTNHSIVKPAKAPIQLSEGYWFELGFTHFYVIFIYFQFLKDYHSISAKKRDWNSNEKWMFMHLSTFFVYRVSGAYCGFMVLILISKIEEICTFKATNLHQNAIKDLFKSITIIRN